MFAAAVLSIVALAVMFVPSASAASAQTGGGVGVTLSCPVSSYPPVTVSEMKTITVTSAHFTPGGSGHLGLAGVIANHSYIGTIFSAPIPIGPSTSDASGNLAFDFAVPADFALTTFHTASITCGGAMFTVQFCVDSSGLLASDASCTEVGGLAITADTSSGGESLARTGMDHLWDLIRIAAALIAVGALLVHAKHRREAAMK